MVIVLGLLTALILAACGSQAGEPASPATAAPVATTAPQPATAAPAPSGDNAPADTLRWSLEGVSDLSSIDPAKPGDAPTITAINLIFAGLIRLDEKLEVQPDGASEWQVSADGTTYTFTIRDGLVFADGTSVTAGDFVYAINRAAPETASYGVPFQLGHIIGAQDVVDGKAKQASGVRAVDDKTLEIKLDGPLA